MLATETTYQYKLVEAISGRDIYVNVTLVGAGFKFKH